MIFILKHKKSKTTLNTAFVKQEINLLRDICIKTLPTNYMITHLCGIIQSEKGITTCFYISFTSNDSRQRLSPSVYLLKY